MKRVKVIVPVKTIEKVQILISLFSFIFRNLRTKKAQSCFLFQDSKSYFSSFCWRFYRACTGLHLKFWLSAAQTDLVTKMSGFAFRYTFHRKLIQVTHYIRHTSIIYVYNFATQRVDFREVHFRV
jgi:hypothetical protein